MRKLMQIGAAGALILAMLSLSPVGQAFGRPAADGGVVGTASHGIVHRGSVNLRSLISRAQVSGRAAAGASVLRKPVGAVNRRASAAVPVPNPPPTPTVNGSGGARGFVALTNTQSTLDNGFSVEPPDQGLCAHLGQMMETVNLDLQVFTENGSILSPPVSLNAFFGLAPAVSQSNGHNTFGPFISDPRCYFDGQTGRWFVTVLEIDVNPITGALGFRSSELLAVSQTADPLGGYGLFTIDTTNDGTDGTPPQANCPCFGDQPRIGADAHGFYISADSYPIQGLFNSNGGEIFAMSKQGLAKAATGAGPTPILVSIYNGAIPIGGFPANAVQPAQTPEGGTYAANREYFLSTPDFNGFATAGGAGARALVLWTLTGTSSLNSFAPSVTLTNSLVPSEPFAPPVNATQKPGPRPLGQSLNAPLPPISVNDDRMQQVEYTGGQLYSSLNTGIGANNSADRSGVAWFVVTPHGSTGTMAHQGYLATGAGATLLYPAIGLTPAANGVMTFSVSGPNRYPSHAYIAFNQMGPQGSIYIDGPGTAPEDGFTCYTAEGFGPACRWGDYSAASADGQGNIVMGTEAIRNVARTQIANWATFISVRPAS